MIDVFCLINKFFRVSAIFLKEVLSTLGGLGPLEEAQDNGGLLSADASLKSHAATLVYNCQKQQVAEERNYRNV